jgi:hypothetical protein
LIQRNPTDGYILDTEFYNDLLPDEFQSDQTLANDYLSTLFWNMDMYRGVCKNYRHEPKAYYMPSKRAVLNAYESYRQQHERSEPLAPAIHATAVMPMLGHQFIPPKLKDTAIEFTKQIESNPEQWFEAVSNLEQTIMNNKLLA